MTITTRLRHPLPLAAGFFLVATLAHLLALPLSITWDGHQYLGLVELLGSERYLDDWPLIRTPLFPLALKLSFEVLGRNPLAAKAIPLAMAVLGCLLLASAIKTLIGERMAAVSLVLLALYPTLIAFQHMILTETGTFFFLACAIRVSLWTPETPTAGWRKAILIGLVLGVGFYWRQSLLLLGPWFGALHCGSFRGFVNGRRAWTLIGLQAVLIAALPWGLSRPWIAQFESEKLQRLNATVLRSFVIRQAVLPPEDPRMAHVKDEYRRAIAATERDGFLSGIPWPAASAIANQITVPRQGALSWFAEVIGEYPGRYTAAVGRSLVYFVGFDAAENEIRGLRTMLLSPVIRNTLIAAGPPQAQERAKAEMSLSTGSGLLKVLLLGLGDLFDGLLIAANLSTVGLFLFALMRRRIGLLALVGTPILYALIHALFLLSINRLMVPVYPITLVAGLLGMVGAVGRLAARVRPEGGPVALLSKKR